MTASEKKFREWMKECGLNDKNPFDRGKMLDLLNGFNKAMDLMQSRSCGNCQIYEYVSEMSGSCAMLDAVKKMHCIEVKSDFYCKFWEDKE